MSRIGRLSRMSLLMFTLAAGMASAGLAPAGLEALSGSWSGPLRCGDEEGELFLHFKLQDQDMLAWMELPKTNVHVAGLGKVEAAGDGFKVYQFTMKLSPDGSSLTGTFQFYGRSLPFELKKRTVSGRVTPVPPHIPSGAPPPAWTFKAPAAIWSSPAVSGSAVYFGSNDGHLYALEAKTGKPLWQFQAGRAILARPTVAGDELYVPSDDGFLYKLDAKTGKEVWRFDLHAASFERKLPNQTDFLYDTFASAATLVDGTVYIGSPAGRLIAIDAQTGTERFSFAAGGPVRSTPALAEGLVIFGSFDHFVYAVDAKSGALRWKHDTGDLVTSSPAYADGTVYIGSRSAELYALEAQSGQVKWSTFYWMSWVESSAVVKEDVVYVGSSDFQLLLAIDTKTGKPMWTFDTEGSAWSTPAVTEDTVYIGAAGAAGYMVEHKGGFFAVDRKTGREKWGLALPAIPDAFISGVVSSPAVGEGLVYFGSVDGTFYALPAR